MGIPQGTMTVLELLASKAKKKEREERDRYAAMWRGQRSFKIAAENPADNVRDTEANEPSILTVPLQETEVEAAASFQDDEVRPFIVTDQEAEDRSDSRGVFSNLLREPLKKNPGSLSYFF